MQTPVKDISVLKDYSEPRVVFMKKKEAQERSILLRRLYTVAGIISLALGVIGIVLPLLPTTPFLLLAAACFARGSKRLHNWLINHKLFGKYIRNYQEKKGIPLKVKVLAIAVLWATIGVSSYLFLSIWYIPLILVTIAILITIHITRLTAYRD